MLKVALIVNAGALVLAAFLGGVLSYVGLGFSSTVSWPLVGLSALAALAALLSLRALFAPTRSVLAGVAVASAPFYLLFTLLYFENWNGTRREAANARQFVRGTRPTESAAAFAALQKAKPLIGTRPVATIIGPALDSLSGERRLDAIRLLGALVRHDPPTEQRLVALFRSAAPPVGDVALRSAALAALRQMRPYEIDGRRTHFERLEPDGSLTFSLREPHWIYGDTLNVMELILTLPRSVSTNPCEHSAAPKAESLIVSVLGPQRMADVVEIEVMSDGRLRGAVRAETGLFVKDSLHRALPSYVEPGAVVDWCTDPPSVPSRPRN
jgi:hypothetical protein